MFDKKEYWLNRKEGLRGQGVERTEVPDMKNSLPDSIRKYRRQKWSNPIFTKAYSGKKLKEVRRAHAVRAKRNASVK